jgi:hypothetical protein
MEEFSLRCLLDTPGLRLFYDKARGWLYNQWLGIHDEWSVQKGAGDICACLHAQSFTRILSDHSGLVGSWPGNSPWITRAYFDRLAAQNIAYFAFVCHDGYHDCALLKKMLHDIERPIVDIFDDVVSAYDWLRRCPYLPEEWPNATLASDK